jgi:predicted phosphodiesterase
LRIAVLSDVHSNRQALESVLEAIEETGIERLWCLGDVVGYGADPDACTALVREHCELSLVGNHDLAVLDELDTATFSETAAEAVGWTREHAEEKTMEFLRAGKPAMSRDGFGLFHASPRDPIWEYVLSFEQAEAGLDALEEKVGLIGHSHISLFFTRPLEARPSHIQGSQASEGARLDLTSGAWLLNPGSVGQPRDGDPRAGWLELDTEELTARYHRVPYDTGAAGAAILAAGLPAALAERLQVGR